MVLGVDLAETCDYNGGLTNKQGPAMSEVLAFLAPTKPRRLFAAGMFCILALILLYLAVIPSATSLAIRFLQVAAGVGLLLQARRLWRATANGLVLREDGFFDLHDRQICAMDNIESVDRGFLAFKPSNGFLVRMHHPMPREWAPGLWWRLGRRLGVGGTITGGDSKNMADVLAVYLQSKNQDDFRPK